MSERVTTEQVTAEAAWLRSHVDDGEQMNREAASLCHWIASRYDRLAADRDALLVDNQHVRGAMEAQDEREREAGELCGVPYHEYTCEWPDAVAEEVLVQRARAERAERERDEARAAAKEDAEFETSHANRPSQPDAEPDYSKLKATLEPGQRVEWYYDDDRQYAEEWGESPRECDNWVGIIVPKDDTEIDGGQLHADHCNVVMIRHPTEMCYPLSGTTDLEQLLSQDGLVEIYDSTESDSAQLTAANAECERPRQALQELIGAVESAAVSVESVMVGDAFNQWSWFDEWMARTKAALAASEKKEGGSNE